MAGKLIECVANFSEGRDGAAMGAIERAIAGARGVLVLRSEMDADHNRSVITFAGPPKAVEEGALRGITVAVERIDLRSHSGVHPRIGAADVVPFVPLEGVTLDECVEIAHRTGETVWKRLGVPVYFYEAAARSPERAPLENCRRGGFEHPKLLPDLGGPELHPSAGACVIGARKLLIAFNVNLNTSDVAIAQAIARKVRASSGGLPFVKALGRPLGSRKIAQVSMNLTDFERTPLHQVFDAVRAEAAGRGVSIEGSEIIGLIPRKAFEDAAAHYLQCENFTSQLILENRLAGMQPAPSHWGGSAVALTAALAAELGSKLCRLTRAPDQFREAVAFFSQAVDRDREAFQAAVKGGAAKLEAATQVPVEVAEAACRLIQSLSNMKVHGPAASDLEVSLLLADAARRGAAATARANLAQMKDGEVKARLEARLRAIE